MLRSCRILSVLAAVFSIAPQVRAQCQPVWQETPVGTPTTDVSGSVINASQAWTPAGENTRIVVGGSFTTCSGVSAGNMYAKCDGSAVAPILNANDFQCYLNAFAAGCN